MSSLRPASRPRRRRAAAVASQRAVRVALVVRALALACAIAVPLLVTVVGQSLPAVTRDVQEAMRCGVGPCDRAASSAVAETVDQLRLQGLVCGTRARLTDTVVVEWLSGRVEVVTFDEALRVAADRSGWLRSYCVLASAGR